jgi:hypothetical protein
VKNTGWVSFQLFRIELSYFRETGVETIQGSERTAGDGKDIQDELLRALESARSRLAIAIAVETKSTPRDRRQYYLETAEYMRRFVGRLRREGESVRQGVGGWEYALEALKRIPLKDAAFPLCRRLRNIVMRLE